MLQIQKYQQDLDNLRDAIDKQEAQIGRLSDQATYDSKHPESLQNIEERLATTERHLVELHRRIAASDQISSQMYELKCHLQNMQTKKRHHDQAIEQALARQSASEEHTSLLRERLALAQEDLAAARNEDSLAEAQAQFEEQNRRDEPPPEAAASLAAATNIVDLVLSDQAVASGVLSPVFVEATGSSVGTQADVAEEEEAAGDGSPAGRGARSTLETLRQMVQQFREDKAASKTRRAKEVQELRAQVRGQTSSKRKAEAAEEEAAEKSHQGLDEQCTEQARGQADNLSEGTDAPGLLYAQKIAELEALKEGLERDIELLHSSHECLLHDSREKEDLIRNLMRTAHAQPREGPGAIPRKEQSTTSKVSSSVMRHLRTAIGVADSRQARIEELERIAEEAMLDNMRLRKDFRGIAEEFRKVLVAQDAAKAVEGAAVAAADASGSS